VNQRDQTRETHWQSVYGRRPADEVSWYQSRPDTSLSLIRSCQLEKNAALLDVGGGASVLVDHLLDQDYSDITVLDIAKEALDLSRRRLGAQADQVRWQVADVTEFLPDRSYDLWHDRAVLHFLTDPELRAAYRGALEQALLPGGHLVVGTFAIDGPKKCSGLEIVQYDAAKLLDLLGPEFVLREEQKEAHVTPAGAIQQFAWFALQRIDS
jgi:SAM-dependent methyltransferase